MQDRQDRQSFSSLKNSSVKKSESGHSVAARRFDYEEKVEMSSAQSTPSPSIMTPIDNPFAMESLGDTVVHLDKVIISFRF